MDCGEMSSRGCDDDSASAVSAEGFGGAVEARRSSHVRFSSCNLGDTRQLIARVTEASEWRYTYRASSASNCSNFSAFCIFLGFGVLTSTVGVVSSLSYQ